jgi:hypothetical protein
LGVVVGIELLVVTPSAAGAFIDFAIDLYQPCISSNSVVAAAQPTRKLPTIRDGDQRRPSELMVGNKVTVLKTFTHLSIV